MLVYDTDKVIMAMKKNIYRYIFNNYVYTKLQEEI